MSNHSIRFFNALAAALFDRCIIDDYDFNFERFGRPFTTTANNNGMVVTLINVDSANVFVKYLSDVIPTQFSPCVAMTNGLVLSLEQDETLSQMFMDTEAVFTDAKNRKYDFPYILSICCGQGRYTACLVCTRSSAWQELLDDIVDDATYLVDCYKLPLPRGYLPAHISDDLGDDLGDDEVAPDTTDQHDINKLVNDVMANAVSANLDDLSTEQMMQVTMDAMSNVATRHASIRPVRTYGESELRDNTPRNVTGVYGLDVIDTSLPASVSAAFDGTTTFSSTPGNPSDALATEFLGAPVASFNGVSTFGSESSVASPSALIGIPPVNPDEQLDNPQVVIDAEGNRAFAEVTPAEDFEAYEPYTADAEDFEQLADTASELTPEDTIHVLTQTVALITGEGVTANVYNQIRGFLESCRDRWVKSEPNLLRALVTDFYGTMDNTDAHGIHTGDFVVFNKAEPTETLRSGYHLDLRGIDSLGVYRCTLADTDMRTEWFVAKITPENYVDVMRVMFPRQYSGITIKYVQDFFESLLNEPTQPVEDFTLDNGYYDVRMLAQIDNLDIWLLARVECNFPVVQVAEHVTDDAPAA